MMVSQFAKLFQKIKFRNLQTLQIYFSDWSLENHIYYDMICASLIKLPNLKLFSAVVSDIQSDVNFKRLGNRFKVIVDEEWHNNEKWQ